MKCTYFCCYLRNAAKEQKEANLKSIVGWNFQRHAELSAFSTKMRKIKRFRALPEFISHDSFYLFTPKLTNKIVYRRGERIIKAVFRNAVTRESLTRSVVKWR